MIRLHRHNEAGARIWAVSPVLEQLDCVLLVEAERLSVCGGWVCECVWIDGGIGWNQTDIESK